MNEPKSREALYAVAYSDGQSVPGPYIPTLGYPTSATDLHRVASIIRSGHEDWNSCLVDVDTCSGLARLVEGPVTSLSDLDAAEAALQALMWHDRIDVLVPAFKMFQGQLALYSRCDRPRSELAFSLFAPCQPYDQIYAVEAVNVYKNNILSSTLEGSLILGKDLPEAKVDYLKRTRAQAFAFSALPLHFGVPAYFCDPDVPPFSSARGFFGDFYDRVAGDWFEALATVPDVELSVPIPPLTAIVLDRAPSRTDIPKAIHELREELAPVRQEMLSLSTVVTGAYTQAEVERRCRAAKESFATVVKASRYSAPSPVLPLLKLYKAAKSPLDALIRILSPDYKPSDPRLIANRTVTGRMFSTLLATDSMHSLLSHFFTAAELTNLERSAQERRDA